MLQHNVPITAISLMLSCGCNLQCSYCEIANSTNENSVKVQQETSKALQNGMFLQNTIKSLERLNNSSFGIKNIEFWGQEPTLNLHYFTEHLDDWATAFPNVEKFSFSTNGVAFPERLVEFAKKLDMVYNHPVNFGLQFSYDGNQSNTNYRKLNSENVTNNIKKVITELNQYNFKNLNISINFHSVISNALILELNSIEKIENYCKDLFVWGENLKSLNLNNKVNVCEITSIGLEVPIDASSEDGLRFCHFFKMLKRSESNKTRNYVLNQNIIEFIANVFDRNKSELEEFDMNIFDMLIEFGKSSNGIDRHLFHILNNNMFCGAYLGELKIMYDGTLVNCQSQIFDTKEEFIRPEKTIRNETKRAIARSGRFINLITDSDEHITKVIKLFEWARKDSFAITYNEVVNLMRLMSKCGQIDESYCHDINKLLVHAFIIAKLNVCSINRLIKTGSMFYTNNGQIRFFCNGLLDEIFDLYNYRFKLTKGEVK